MISKRFSILLWLIILTLILSGCKLFSSLKKPDELAKDSLLAKHIAKQVLIKTDNRIALERELTNYQGKILGFIEELNVYQVSLDTSRKGSLLQTINELEKNSHFSYVEPVYLYQLFEKPTDEEFYTRQWGAVSIGLEKALEIAKNAGAGVTLAIIDSGVDYQHPEFAGRVLAGYNALTDEEGYEAAMDDYKHGTHVTGIAAANLNQNKMAGIAPNCNILPIKAITAQGGTDYQLAKGLIWAIEHGADVINLSLGGKGYSRTLQNAIDLAITNDVVVVAAMGNSGKNEVYYPAGCSGVVAVGASTGQEKIAEFSTRGRHISLVAPGENIYSTIPLEMGGYTTDSGTSAATPFVSGAIALLLGEFPQLTVSEVKSRLEASAKDIELSGYDESSGFGIIDLVALLSADQVDKYGGMKVYVSYDDQPMAGVDILVQDLFGHVVENAKTNSQGYGIIYNLASGIYSVTVNIFGYVKKLTDLEIVPGEILELEFTDVVPLEPTTLKGYVVDSWGGSAVKDAQISLVSETTDEVLEVMTDEEGYFCLYLKADTYTLTSMKPGYTNFTYQEVIIEENRVQSVSLLQKKTTEDPLSTSPTIFLTGLDSGQLVSNVLDLNIIASGSSEIDLIAVRFGHMGEQADFQANQSDQLTCSFDTTKKANGKSFLDILVYDVQGNISRRTIPLIIDNNQGGDPLPGKVFVNGCTAFTFGESLGVYRQNVEMLNQRFNLSLDPNIIQMDDQEFDLETAAPDSTIFVQLQWGIQFDARGYKIYRATEFAGPYIQIADLAQTSYRDFSPVLKPGEQYYYQITAYSNSGVGEPSEVIWTEPLDKFNTYLTSPLDQDIVMSVYPEFTWSHNLIVADQTGFVLSIQGITDPEETWRNFLWDQTTHRQEDKLIPGHVYEWNIYEAKAYRNYSEYAGAVSISSIDGYALNGSQCFTVAPDVECIE